jgi:1-deoxy-D-xylulose-5-phosphate reductoisomerase
MSGRKRIAILGSTGSIGRQTLEVVAWHPDCFEVVGLAARSDSALFREQVGQFTPKLAALSGATHDGWSSPETTLTFGDASLVEMATAPDIDVVVVATSGTAGPAPTIAALNMGRPVALANKEVLIMAGHLVTEASRV